ncbi:inositol polyphosphate multikinase alpha isoform X1 [Homalodisca vitripennis]|uniref:inositol polyphosphate multikinase alpha isoform X1 n=2 Tax=Homalodisca vitripennis TaxID=197043 RepID=UPI001EEB95AD|nr:inositol polyphosphate multikinase alpha isoform X1 [Homalodisca vitripennis]
MWMFVNKLTKRAIKSRCATIMEARKSTLFELSKEIKSEFPQNVKPLENQVAGHSFKDGCSTIGMLKDEEGYVFKPINKPELGRREVLFYETVMNSELEVIKELKQFVPEYLGTVELAVNGTNAQFLKLRNATRGYQKPCVMDVKIGRQTWEPGAPVSKQQREQAKYTQCKQQCGFCIPGFHVYNTKSGTTEKYGKDFGKNLSKENIPEVLTKFLNSASEQSKSVGEEMLEQLNRILSWWQYQRIYHIYSSSLLLTYDAEILRTPSDLPLCSSVRVILIDFAHVFPANNTLDLNYLNGLDSFVQIFSSVVNKL